MMKENTSIEDLHKKLGESEERYRLLKESYDLIESAVVNGIKRTVNELSTEAITPEDLIKFSVDTAHLSPGVLREFVETSEEYGRHLLRPLAQMAPEKRTPAVISMTHAAQFLGMESFRAGFVVGVQALLNEQKQSA